MSEYVICSICGNRYVGKVPKGGDGSVLFPRKHKRKIGDAICVGGGRFVIKYTAETCEGSYQAALEYS